LYSTKTEEGSESYEQQEVPKVLASVQFPIVNGTIVNGTHKIGQKQFSLVNCIPTSWVRFIYIIYVIVNTLFYYFLVRPRLRAKIVVNKVVQLEHWN